MNIQLTKEVTTKYKTLWEVIEESKAGKEYLDSETQYENLKNILATMEEENIKQVYKDWKEITSPWHDDVVFNLLHGGNGGFVWAGDDGFYMDFAHWLMVQGEELYNDFKTRGVKAVAEYVNKHKVSEDDYVFECMIYAFHPYID
ncbi:DUF4240 domain-containing protein [Bacillus sp. NEAU-Y102]